MATVRTSLASAAQPCPWHGRRARRSAEVLPGSVAENDLVAEEERPTRDDSRGRAFNVSHGVRSHKSALA